MAVSPAHIVADGLLAPIDPLRVITFGLVGSSSVVAPSPTTSTASSGGGAPWAMPEPFVPSAPPWRAPWVYPIEAQPLVVSEDGQKRTPTELLDRLYRFLELSRSDNPFESSTARTRIAEMLGNREVLDALSDFVRDRRLTPTDRKETLQLLMSARSVETSTSLVGESRGSSGTSEAGWLVAAVMSFLSMGILGPALVLLLRRVDRAKKGRFEPRIVRAGRRRA